jgi:hypothetical protein
MASADQQAARNRKIVIAKARGEDVNTIAARHGLSPARVRQILAAGAAIVAEADGPDPVQIALERRAQYELLYERALALFEQIPDTNPSPKVGALRLALAALDRLSGWEQTVGVMPAGPAWVYKELDARKLGNTLWDAMERADIPEHAIEQVVESLSPVRQDDAPSIEVDPKMALEPPQE